jgi:hypothetical protein
LDNKKINYKVVVITVIAAVIGSMVGRYLMDQFGKSKNIFDKELVEATSEINKNLPIMVDSETRLDSLMALPDNAIQYFYTLVNYSKDEINIEDFKNELSPMVLNNIKTNSDLKSFKDNKITMIYSYRDKNNNELFKLKYEYDDYKE